MTSIEEQIELLNNKKNKKKEIKEIVSKSIDPDYIHCGFILNMTDLYNVVPDEIKQIVLDKKWTYRNQIACVHKNMMYRHISDYSKIIEKWHTDNKSIDNIVIKKIYNTKDFIGINLVINDIKNDKIFNTAIDHESQAHLKHGSFFTVIADKGKVSLKLCKNIMKKIPDEDHSVTHIDQKINVEKYIKKNDISKNFFGYV